jgi:thiopeptide-type bacteriocin biosynthesis protein
MNYRFLNNVMLRSPFYSYDHYSVEKITRTIHDEFFQVSLYLASPQLFRALNGKNFIFKDFNAHERISLLRYYNRMSFRPTPFGSFSSFTVAAWNDKGLISIAGKENSHLHLNIDQGITLRLVQKLITNDKLNNTYTSNPSLYRSGKDFRFVKTCYSEDNEQIFFDLESIESNKLTIALFTFCRDSYQKGSDIIKHMIKITGCNFEIARDYLSFLIEANIIVSMTSPNIIGRDYLSRILDLQQIPFSTYRQALQILEDQLHFTHFPSNHLLSRIVTETRALLPGVEKASLKQFFYSGLERNVLSGGLSPTYQARIIESLKALEVLSTPVQPSALQQFIQDFKIKYDKQKVLLMQAIDPESGIGYGPSKAVGSDNDLLRHVNFTEQQDSKVTLEWSAVHSLLLKRWNGKPSQKAPIEITETDLSGLPAGLSALVPPPTMTVLFRITAAGIYIETAGGVSGTALIGRFTAWSDKVHDLAQQLALKERMANPNVIFADIGQISDNHTDNINRRRHIYDYEIPINTTSTLPADRQISLSDLWISVVGDRLVLESKKMRKEIVTRLTSAYNYNRNNLTIFRFLCDLQHQGLQSNYSLDLERYFPGMAHYPRVTFKTTILSAAVWYLSKTELKTLKDAGPHEIKNRFFELRTNLNLPPIIALSKFDQQLIFDLDKEDEVVFLLDCLKGMDKAVLQEFFLPGEGIVSSDEKPMVNQFIAFLYQDEAVYPGGIPAGQIMKAKAAKEFILGSKWLYLKLYCTPATANDILIKKLLPVLNKLKEPELLSWFFIRYRDSGHHIRLRLRIKEDAIGHVLTLLKKRLAESVHFHLIREYQADTYRREMERYGPDIIDLVEDFFYSSSELVLRYLKVADNESFPHTYHSLAFVSITCLINSFIPEANDQVTFITQMVNLFYAEFTTDKLLKVDLDQKFRELKTEINNLQQDSSYYSSLNLTPWADVFATKVRTLVGATSRFGQKRTIQLLADLIHMHLNRLFIDRQRNQELIVYYCLYKHLLSVRAIQKKKN